MVQKYVTEEDYDKMVDEMQDKIYAAQYDALDWAWKYAMLEEEMASNTR